MSRISQRTIQRPETTAPTKIIRLEAKDFKIDTDGKQNVLCHVITGLSFAFFSSNKCGFCDKFKPVFTNLAPQVNKFCHMLYIDASDGKVVKMSKGTTTPITYVPLLIAYYDGRPVDIYKGEKNEYNIIQWLGAIYKMISQNKPKPFMKQIKKEDDDLGLPYNMYCDDETCYITDGELSGARECKDGECCFVTDKEL